MSNFVCIFKRKSPQLNTLNFVFWKSRLCFKITSLLFQLLLIFSVKCHDGDDGSSNFLFENKDLTIPVKINVGLVGFDSNHYPLLIDGERLSKLLEEILPFHTPYCLETKTKLFVNYAVKYLVKNFSIDPYEELIAKKLSNLLVERHENGSYSDDGIQISNFLKVTQDVKNFFSSLESQFHQMQTQDIYQTKQGDNYGMYTVFILNTEKKRLLEKIRVFLSPDFSGVFPPEEFTYDLVYDDCTSSIYDHSNYPRSSSSNGSGFDNRRNSHSAGSEATTSSTSFSVIPSSKTIKKIFPGQSWISGQRYVVIDLGAGPAHYGCNGGNRRDSNGGFQEGIVDSKSFPRLDSNSLLSNIEMEAMLASLVVSAARHVFLCDVQFETIQHAERLLIPIIVLRNHKEFNPFELDTDYTIDMGMIRREVKRMFFSKQDISVVTGLHSLHDHRHLALAIEKARRSDSVYEMTADGRFRASFQSFLDSRMLFYEFGKVEDFLGSGLLDLSSLHKSSFFNPKVPEPLFQARKHKKSLGITNDEETDNDKEDDVFFDNNENDDNDNNDNKEEESNNANESENQSSPKRRISSALSSSYNKPRISVETKPKENDDDSPVPSRSTGTRILPVYVLSLLGKENNLLLDDFQLMEAESEAVLVIQTNSSSILSPYFIDEMPLEIDARNPTRSIIAGIAKAIGGIVDPSAHYSPIHSRLQRDYRWALGHHPFGHFSSCTSLSSIHLDIVLRNSILSRIDNSMHIIKDAIQEVDRFANEYLYNPFVEDISHARNSSWKIWIDRLYHNQMEISPSMLDISPIATTIVYHFHQELKQLETQLDVAGNLLFNNKLADAYEMSASFLNTARAFRGYVYSKISEAEQDLLCCSLYTETKQSAPIGNLLYISALGLAVFIAVLYFAGGFPEVRSIQRRLKFAME